MNRNQFILIGAAILLFLGLYFGASTKPSDYSKIEKKRALSAESTGINSLLLEAKPALSTQEGTFILSLEKQIAEADTDSVRVEGYKNLASKWYEYNRADISGYYAEKVATLDQTEQAWSIAGTTYLIGARQATADKIKQFCSSNAVKAFESAISINPENIAHKVNLATSYAENPPPSNPMKGVLMLLELNKSNPESVAVLVSLGRFGIQTGQFDKASERLKKAISLDPTNKQAHCFLAEAQAALGNQAAAADAQTKCASL